VLADFQITIPELGTIKAAHPPIVVVTSNRTREFHDALKRRCLYHWVGYPTAEPSLHRAAKVPGIAKRLSAEVVHSSRRCAARTCSNRRASPRRSIGPGALTELMPVALDPATVSIRSACCQISRRYRADRRFQGEGAGDGLRAELRVAE